jgi:hypothetical protein
LVVLQGIREFAPHRQAGDRDELTLTFRRRSLLDMMVPVSDNAVESKQ